MSHRIVTDKPAGRVSCECGWSATATSGKAAFRLGTEHVEKVWTCGVCGLRVSRKSAWNLWRRPDGSGVDHGHCHGGPNAEERKAWLLKERREHRAATRAVVVRGDARYAPIDGRREEA